MLSRGWPRNIGSRSRMSRSDDSVRSTGSRSTVIVVKGTPSSSVVQSGKWPAIICSSWPRSWNFWRSRSTCRLALCAFCSARVG